MENLLREYMIRAFSETGTGKPSMHGPVVTFSRESGCPSKLIAQHLTNALNERKSKNKSEKWQFIKEIYK